MPVGLILFLVGCSRCTRDELRGQYHNPQNRAVFLDVARRCCKFPKDKYFSLFWSRFLIPRSLGISNGDAVTLAVAFPRDEQPQILRWREYNMSL